ncbi:MAG: PVC-type heme-binding CxxCH protein [Planctomycetaceae bacterium]
MESPQTQGVGRESVASREDYAILSGQEYRSRYYGHINFFLIDQLVFDGSSHNANDWPPFGLVAQRVREEGGIAFYAHGGYAQEIYADVVQGNVDGVELLQFGVYRGIGLNDWYHMLNAGFRVPANGACDYPACRKLGDCRTYVFTEDEPNMENWLRGMARGRSFITSGPVLLLDVEGSRPGDQIERSGQGPHVLNVKIRVRSDVAPVTNIQLIGNGRVIREMTVPRRAGQGNWLELEQRIECDASTWIAARAFSLSPTGTPDAESHTNPVYVVVDDKAPYNQDSLDALVRAVDGQIEIHKKREFEERAKVIAYFERSRDILMKIREIGGAPAAGHPSAVAATSHLGDPGQLQHSDDELREFLKPVPPRSIDEALNSFETIDGFEMQLVAHEPMVVDPIAAAFDANGNLYVCEMRDYPYKPTEGHDPIGTLRLLRDTNDDGTFDQSHVFADKLLWAGGVAPWKDGVFVAAAPDIWYVKDTDGDHQADIREKIYTGFGTGNQQAMLNNLTWGLDHKIYGSTAHNGGLISTVGGPAQGAAPVSVTGHDFRFDPVTGKFEAITGTVQFGNTFDDWGNRFLCSESRPLMHAMLPEHYLARNPYLPVPSAIRNVTGGVVPIFRISPLERWRIIRSSRRVAAGGRSPHAAGASHHVMDAAAGVTIYRGAAFPDEFRGDVFIGGAQNNLIHRRQLTPDGITFTSERADDNTEFVRSSDNWFRPVNFVNAPDGSLYVLDMYREVLESIHVPDDVVRHLDLTSGRNHGRIYRIAPGGFEPSAAPQLASASTSELVAALESPHGWWRDTAQRLLFERQDQSAIHPLRTILTNSRSPLARLHALRSLDGLKAIVDADLVVALSDNHSSVREHAMQLAEPRLDQSPKLLQSVIAHTEHQNVRLRVQAAFSLGESRDPQAAAALAKLAESSAEQESLRTAVLSSVGSQPLPLFQSLAAGPGKMDLLKQLAAMIGSRGNYDEVDAVLDTLATLQDTARQSDLLLKLGLALRAHGTVLAFNSQSTNAADRLLRTHLNSARATAVDQAATTEQRKRSVALLSCATLEYSGVTLQSLLDIAHPEAVQLAAVNALAGYRDAQIAGWLLDGWSQQTPAVRTQVVATLLARPQWMQLFLQAAVHGTAGVAQVDSTQRSLLLSHSSDSVRSLAQQLFAGTNSDQRSTILASYQPAIASHGTAKAGETVFRRECAACHRLDNVGHAIGPNLASSPARDPAAMLNHILDPNRYVLPNYESYVVVDASGRIFTGMIAEQTATSITLRRAENQSDTILRTNIDELAGTGQSLMPEGLEKKINVQEMSDLLAYLQATKQPGDNAVLAVGTLPGLIEPVRIPPTVK